MKRMFMLLVNAAVTGLHGQAVQSSLETTPFIRGSFSNKFADASAISSNLSALMQVHYFSATILKEQKFMLKELNAVAATIAFPIPTGAMAVKLIHSGNLNYRESTIGIVYAKNIGKVDLGMQVAYHLTAIKGYSRQTSGTIAFACTWHLTEQFHTGFQINNMNRFFTTRVKHSPAANVSLGMGYDISPLVYMEWEWSKEETQPMNIIGGLIYQFHQRCRLYLGISTSQPQPYIGAELFLNGWSLGIKTAYHLQLGFSPCLWLSFQKKDKKNNQ